MTRPAAPIPSVADYQDEDWAAGLFRVVLIVLLAASLTAGPMLIRQAFGGGWPSYLITLSAAVGAEAVLTTRILGQPSSRSRSRAAVRLGEMTIILILARIAVWLLVEGLPGPRAVASWLIQPGRFFTGEFIFAGGVLLFAWSTAASMAADLQALAIRPDEVAARTWRGWNSAKSELRVPLALSRAEILQRFAVRWIGLGALLVVCAAITRVAVTTDDRGILRIGLRGLGLSPEATAALVCYFIAGLLLLSHGRLAALRGAWYNQEVDIRGPLIARWHRSSTALVVLIALGALLLPLGATSWLAGPLAWVIALLARIALVIVYLAGALFTLLMNAFGALFGVSEEAAPPATPAPAPAAPTPPEVAVQLPPWLGGALLWLTLAVVAGVLLLNLVRTSGLLDGPLGERLRRLRFWWRARRVRLNRAVSTQFKQLRRRLRLPGTPLGRPAAPRAALRRGHLPRDRVRQYYLRAVEQAAQEGAPRPAHKTPLEYARDLEATWPEAETDVTDLTASFLDARYTAHDIGETAAADAENAWRRLVRALRGSPNPQSSGSPARAPAGDPGGGSEEGG
mgnify:CR=1 FL=1